MRKFNIIAIVTALAASTLAGCGTANTKIDFDPDHIIASIKDSDVKLDYATANTYVRIMQAETYDYAQGVMEEDETPSDDIWSEVLTEKTENGYQTYGEVFKDETLDNLKTMLVSEEHMDDYNITFTDDEQERWNTVADDFVEKTDDAALEAMHADKASIVNTLRLMAIQDRIKTKVKKEADVTVDDTDVQQTTFSYTTVYKDSFNDPEQTAKDIKTAFEKSEDKDFSAAVSEQGITSSDVTITTNDPDYDEIGLDKDLVDEIMKLNDGECGYYTDKNGNIEVFYMTAKNDKDATNAKRSSKEEEKKTEYYNDTIEKWKDAAEIEIDKKAWDSIKVNKNAIYTELHENDADDSDTTVTATDDGGTVATGDSSVSVGVTASDGGEVNADVTTGKTDDAAGDTDEKPGDKDSDTKEEDSEEIAENNNNIDNSDENAGSDDNDTK